MGKMKSIKVKITLLVIACIVPVFIGMMFYMNHEVEAILMNNQEQNLLEAAEEIAQRVEQDVASKITLAQILADNNIIQDGRVSVEAKVEILDNFIGVNPYILSFGYADSTGKYKNTMGGTDQVTGLDFFEATMKGQVHMSTPYQSPATPTTPSGMNMVMTVSVPVYNTSGGVIGCLVIVEDAIRLSKMIGDAQWGETGEAYIMDNEGTMIAYEIIDAVMNKNNNIKNAESNPVYSELAGHLRKALAGEHGVGYYTNDQGAGRILSYHPIKGTDGWVVALMLQEDEVLASVGNMNRTITMTAVMGLVIVAILMYLIIRQLVNRLMKFKKAMEELAQGNLDIKLEEKELQATDEIGVIFNAFRQATHEIKYMIHQVKVNGKNVATHANRLEQEVEGMVANSQNITLSMSETAAGNAEQTSQLSKISAFMYELGGTIQKMASQIENMRTSSEKIKTEVVQSNDEIQVLAKSIEELEASFIEFNISNKNMEQKLTHIQEFVSVINGISEQTYLHSMQRLKRQELGNPEEAFQL